MGVEVVLDGSNDLSVRKEDIGQFLHAVRVVNQRATVGHFNVLFHIHRTDKIGIGLGGNYPLLILPGFEDVFLELDVPFLPVQL